MNQPVIVIVAGPNGSGKTSVTETLLLHHWLKGCHYINPDNIARDEFGDWNSPEAIKKAATRAAELREQCLAERKSMAFETVLSVADKIDFLQRAKDAGYFIRLFFVGTSDPAINARRVAIRVKEGGHTVPLDKITKRYAKSIANFLPAALLADRSYLYDNSIDDAEPTLLLRASCGRIEKVYTKIPAWAHDVYTGLLDSCRPMEIPELSVDFLALNASPRDSGLAMEAGR